MVDQVLVNCNILVVEDDYLLADDISRALTKAGAMVVGPVPTLAAATKIMSDTKLASAVLDINLRGEAVFSLATVLREQGTPIVFASGYDSTVVPVEFRDVTLVQKPFEASALVDAVVRCMSDLELAA